jgi:hypothetical protein
MRCVGQAGLAYRLAIPAANLQNSPLVASVFSEKGDA